MINPQSTAWHLAKKIRHLKQTQQSNLKLVGSLKAEQQELEDAIENGSREINALDGYMKSQDLWQYCDKVTA